MQTIMQGSYTIRYTWIYSTETYRKVTKRVESSADLSYFMQQYPKNGALLRFFHRYSKSAIKSCAA